MKSMHIILGAIVAIVVVTTLYNHFSKIKTSIVEGLDSGSDGTISDQLKEATKGLDGASELMRNIGDLTKNKTEVTELIASYKSFLKNGITAGVVLTATGASKDINSLTSGSSEAKQRENDLSIYKKQLDYVGIAEEIVNGGMPIISGKKMGGWLN